MNRRGRILHWLWPLAWATAAVFILQLSDRHNAVKDFSRGGRNTLTPASQNVLALLPEALEVTALVPADSPVQGGIRDFIARYQRHKAALSLRFVDARKDPDAAAALGGNLGEIVFAYAGRRERVSELNESTVTNALARLARGGERFITVLSGHGERRVARGANHDLSLFAERLEARGLKFREWVPGTSDAVPDNTVVAVLASPSKAYVSGELAAINAYIAGGGNLLWLTEPDAPAALGALERALGFARLPGTIVDPIGLAKFNQPAYAIALAAEPHALARDFDQTLAFPYAAALVAEPNIDWHARALLKTQAQAWTETGTFAGNVGYDAKDEVQGALTLALALTKPRADAGEQRVAIVGDGDFLANNFVDNLGNAEYGRRLFEWLAGGDALIEIAVPRVVDAELDLALWQRVTLFFFFGVGLPAALALNGALLWWRQRHA